MSEYGWIITKDHQTPVKIPGVYSGPNVMGPSWLTDDMEARLKKGEGEAFKMYDDDMELYYTGKILGDFEGFEPLDDYGTPNSGAVHIKYKGKSGKWEFL